MTEPSEQEKRVKAEKERDMIGNDLSRLRKRLVREMYARRASSSAGMLTDAQVADLIEDLLGDEAPAKNID